VRIHIHAVCWSSRIPSCTFRTPRSEQVTSIRGRLPVSDATGMYRRGERSRGGAIGMTILKSHSRPSTRHSMDKRQADQGPRNISVNVLALSGALRVLDRRRCCLIDNYLRAVALSAS